MYGQDHKVGIKTYSSREKKPKPQISEKQQVVTYGEECCSRLSLKILGTPAASNRVKLVAACGTWSSPRP